MERETFIQNYCTFLLSIIYHLNMHADTIAEKSRHPGNWLPLLRGQKRRKMAKNDVKLQKSAQNQRKIRRNGMCNLHTFICRV